jgi:AcrR family transcriptional regulator
VTSRPPAEVPVRSTSPDAATVGSPLIAGLLPTTHQERSADTVLACVRAAVALLDAGGEHALTVEAVRARAGVTTGSIYHHFGDLSRLLTVARAVRSQRSIEGPLAEAVARYTAAGTAAEIARITRSQVVGRDSAEARATVWALTDAIAAARDLPALRDVVAGLVRGMNDRMSAVLAEHRDAGRIAPDFHPRPTMLLSRALAHVRLLDDLDPRPVPHRDWVVVACRIHEGLIGVDPLPPCTWSSGRRRADLAAAIVRADLGDVADAVGGDARVTRLVARTRDLLVSGGPELVQVARLRAELGVSAGWFHRAFGDRDGLLAAARLDLLERTLRAEVRSFDRLVAASRDPLELVGAVADWVAAPAPDETVRRIRWQRADLLVSARTSPALGHEAGRLIAAATDDLAGTTTAAQDRGLLRPDLAPHAVARVVQALVFGPLLAELDATPIARDAWVDTVRRGLLPLTS